MGRLDMRVEKLERQHPDEDESLDGLSPSEQWKRLCNQGKHLPWNAPAMSAGEAWRISWDALVAAQSEPT